MGGESAILQNKTNKSMNTDQTKPAKPGVFTSEFWLVVAFTALVQLGPLLTGALQSTQWGPIANALLIAVYAMVRTNAKKVGVVVPMLLLAIGCLFFTSCGLSQQEILTLGEIAARKAFEISNQK